MNKIDFIKYVSLCKVVGFESVTMWIEYNPSTLPSAPHNLILHKTYLNS